MLSFLSAIQFAPILTLENAKNWIYTYKFVFSTSRAIEMKEAPFQVVFAVIKAVWRFIGDVATSTELRPDERDLCDSDLIGELNHRTSRLDAGHDPYGWYDQD